MDDYLTTACTQHSTYILNNDIYTTFKDNPNKSDTVYQLVSPYCHRRNILERTIQAFKAHSKVGFSTIDPRSLLQKWDHFISQVKLTLNLLRVVRTTPILFTHTYLFGIFNFKVKPIAPT